jgi:hypothetical protein
LVSVNVVPLIISLADVSGWLPLPQSLESWVTDDHGGLEFVPAFLKH